MLYVVLALAASNLFTAFAFARLLHWQQRASTRERDLLLNQMCNLAGKPWQQAPAATEFDAWRAKLDDEAREQRRSWTTNPEQEI